MVEYKYDAWGDHNIILSEPSYENLAKANPFRYRGYYYDEGIGLYYLKSRYYDPEVGRFITIDDIIASFSYVMGISPTAAITP